MAGTAKTDAEKDAEKIAAQAEQAKNGEGNAPATAHQELTTPAALPGTLGHMELRESAQFTRSGQSTVPGSVIQDTEASEEGLTEDDGTGEYEVVHNGVGQHKAGDRVSAADLGYNYIKDGELKRVPASKESLARLTGLGAIKKVGRRKAADEGEE